MATEVFIGRDPELEALNHAFDAARAGHGRLVLLAGEPGIGKTRTALELTANATQLDARIAWGRCHEEKGAPPYWPWVQILRTTAAGRDPDTLRTDLDAGAADIADILPEIRTRLPEIDTPVRLRDAFQTRFRLFGSITSFLINVSRRHPLILVLDDLHWADVPSLHLLEFLAQEIADSRLLIVGTYRDTELSRQHRLSDTLGTLARVPHAVRLHLSGLNADDVRRFVATAAGMVPPAWLTSAIHDQTEGNPLFVREVVRFLAQQGHFRTATTPTAIRLPEGVREVIGRRLNLLPALCNEILATASVIGREFTLDGRHLAGKNTFGQVSFGRVRMEDRRPGHGGLRRRRHVPRQRTRTSVPRRPLRPLPSRQQLPDPRIVAKTALGIDLGESPRWG